MSVQHYLRRFLRKFVFDVLPGALASLVGAMFFAQHWAQPAPPAAAPRADNAGQLAQQSEEITRMVRDEHALMVRFLAREQAREAARQPLTVSEMKAKEAAGAAPRRAGAEPVREAKSAPSSVPPSRLATVSLPPPPAKPAGDVVAVDGGPLTAPEPPVAPPEPPLATPEPKRGGGFAWALALADRAVDVTGLRQIPALVRTITGGTDSIGDEFQTVSDARLVGAAR